MVQEQIMTVDQVRDVIRSIQDLGDNWTDVTVRINGEIKIISGSVRNRDTYGFFVERDNDAWPYWPYDGAPNGIKYIGIEVQQ